MDAIGRKIGVMMTYGLLGEEKQGFFRIPGSGYDIWIPLWEMRPGVSLVRGVSVVRDHTP